MLWGRRNERNIVWILGSPRSGSTWLMLMLKRHPDVVALDEPMIGAFLAPFVAEQPGVDGALLTTDNFTMRRAAAHRSEHFFAEEFADTWVPALGSLITERLAAHAERYPPASGSKRPLVVVKEPNGSQSADAIMRALPQSRMLFLLRDGRDVVDSELAGSAPDGWVGRLIPGFQGVAEEDRLEFIRQAARKWLWRTEVVEEAYAAHTGPKLKLRYEDLLAEPVERMREVLDWLGAPLAEEQLVDLVESRSIDKAPASDRGPKGFFRSASPGRWRENLSADEQEAMLEIIGPKLAETAYA